MKKIDELRKTLKDDIIKMDETYDFFLTGNPMLDAFVGSGGFPKYQMEYMWGLNSIGKSTLAIQILASYQKQYGDNCIVIYFDKEQSVTKMRLEKLGVDVSKLIIVNPKHIERMVEILKTIRNKTSQKNIDMFAIWDTVVMTQSLEQYNGQSKLGSHARALSEFFKDVDFNVLKLTMLALDQHREKIGAMWEELSPPSANVVKHKSFLTINGKAKKSVILEGVDVGRTVTLHTVKSKIISPKRKMEFEMTYVGGYDAILTMFNYMYNIMKIMRKKGGRGCSGCWEVEGVSEKMRLDDWYEYFLTDTSVDLWKKVIMHLLDTLYPYDYDEIIDSAKDRIFNYYFENDKFHIDRFTSVNKELMKKFINLKYNKDNKEKDDDIIDDVGLLEDEE